MPKLSSSGPAMPAASGNNSNRTDAMILCLGTTPAVQRVMVFRQVVLDQVNRAVATYQGAAGKAVNVAKVLQVLGATPVAIGFLGGATGEFLRATLAAQGIETDFVTVQAPTRMCVTVIDQAAGTTTELVEESAPVDPADFDRLLELVTRRLPGCRGLVMSGTLAPGGPPDLYAQCIRLARAAGVLTVLDATGQALMSALPAQPNVVKPNRTELAASLGRALPDEAAVLEAMDQLRDRGAQQVVVTSSRAPVLACDGQRRWRITPPQIQPVNPIGSGDAFAAGLIWRLTCGDDLAAACRWACAAGAANALTLLPGEVQREAVERLVQQVTVQEI